MTKDLAAKQRDLYFQNLLAGENDEKEKNKASSKRMNKSDKLEKKKQLDEKRRLAREKMMKKIGGKGGSTSVLLGFGKRKSADEDETEETTITGIPGPPTDAKPLTRKELNRLRFFRVAFPLGVGGACGFVRVSFCSLVLSIFLLFFPFDRARRLFKKLTYSFLSFFLSFSRARTQRAKRFARRFRSGRS
jgi:hypothetical protein